MRPACVAIVGKSNNPIYVQTFGAADDELKVVVAVVWLRCLSFCLPLTRGWGDVGMDVV